MFITPAFAQAAGAPAATDQIFQLLMPIVLIGAIMYFLVLRPQQKAARERADVLKNIRRGDTVVTSGGIIGKVTKVVDDSELEVEIAANVRVRVARAMVSEVRAKGEPVKDVAKPAA
ncbi:MAG: preprotein translocase subunit YajC [Beijerinckiaceae bacterium]|nr:preprotein translocase subunit YajC [Beijerinckiaceae bacterium]